MPAGAAARPGPGENTVEKMYASREDIGYDFGDDSKAGSKPIKPNPNIDGGWAWMIVLSSFLVHILIMGSQMALGILNMEWLEEFNQSRGLTAWVSSLSMGITLIVGPFIGLFITMCGCRKTAIIGGILNALGWILSAYASNVHFLFLTFGVTAGWIYDITHKYDFSFYICGLLYLVGILFLFIQPYIGKKQPREKSTEEEQV